MYSETENLLANQYSGTESKDSNDLKKVLIGALAGAAIGSLVGSLYTEKGTRTRMRVSDGSTKLARRVKEKASDISEGIKEKASNITGKITDKVDATKETLTNIFKKGDAKSSLSSVDSAYATDYEPNVEISKTKVLLALLAASTAGTIVWSFTTEKGKETRSRISSSSKRIAADVKAKVPVIVQTLQDAYNDAKRGAEELLEKEKQNTSASLSGRPPGSSMA